jgi:hypothetical protein
MSLSDRDRAELLDYVDGLLVDESRVFRLEERLATEPELAAAYDRMARTDLLASFVQGQEPARAPALWAWRPPRSAWALAAAAAGILALAYFRPGWPRRVGESAAPAARVGLLASGRDTLETSLLLAPRADELVALAPYLDPESLRSLAERGKLFEFPPAQESLRGETSGAAWGEILGLRAELAAIAPPSSVGQPPQEPPVDHPRVGEWRALLERHDELCQQWTRSVDEYWELVEPVQAARIARSLADGAPALEADFFHVTLEPSEDCSLLVFVIDRRGELHDAGGAVTHGPAYPAFGEEWAVDSARFSGGKTTVLPGAPLVRSSKDGLDSIENEGGFAVPFGCGQLDVLLGMRSQALDEELRRSLAAFLSESRTPAPTAKSGESERAVLRAWLEARSFVVHELTIEERN